MKLKEVNYAILEWLLEFSREQREDAVELYLAEAKVDVLAWMQ